MAALMAALPLIIIYAVALSIALCIGERRSVKKSSINDKIRPINSQAGRA